MKIAFCICQVLFLGVVLASATTREVSAVPGGAASPLINTIEGIVWDPNHRPVADVYVELQNEMMMSLARSRTTSSGRFSFQVANPGNYYVKVLAGGTQFMDASELVEIVAVTNLSSDQANVDIYLKVDKNKVNTVDGPSEVIFAQNVPDEAKKLYENAAKDLIANRDEAFDELDQALKIFPNYFAALNLAGTQYVERKQYDKALPYLVKSVIVNERSFSSYYALAYACYQLNHRPEATEAARGATILSPNSVNAQLLYGTLLRLNGDFPNAEKALKQAESLGKGAALPDVHMQLALLYNRTKRNKDAITELEAYLKAAPNAANKKEVEDLIEKLKKES
jgi:Flp pilus assembly protein TadD